MKITQSIVVASLSVAAHSSAASPLPDLADHLLSPRAPKVALGGARPSRIVSRGVGRRAPSQSPSDLPPSDIAQPGSPASDATNLATGATGGLRATSGLLSGPVGGALSKALGTAADTLQGVPVVGDLTKALPLDALSQGDPLASIVGVASSTIAGLPVVGGPLAGALNTANSLTQALPLSLAAVPDNRAVVPPTYSYNQVPVTASLLAAAGGAFPLQPSRSLDGATLPYDVTTPHLQADMSNSQQPQMDNQVEKQQYPEDTESEQVEMQGIPDEDDHAEDSQHDGHISEYPSRLQDNSAADTRAMLPPRFQQAASPSLPYVPTNYGFPQPTSSPVPAPAFPDVPTNYVPQPPTTEPFPITTPSVASSPSSVKSYNPKPSKRSFQMPSFRREGPSKRTFLSLLSPVEHGDDDTEETPLIRARISLNRQRNTSGSSILRRWWGSHSLKASKS